MTTATSAPGGPSPVDLRDGEGAAAASSDEADGHEHLPGPRRPHRIRGYATVMGVYSVAVAGAGAYLWRRRPVPVPGWSEVALIGLATHKLSRLITKEVVTTPIRAPFTEMTGHGGPAEVNERAVGEGWKHSLGELLSCPFCAGVWIATGLTIGTMAAPVTTRAVLTGAGAVAVADFLHIGYTIAGQAAE
jgi:hypothetical protein